MRFCNIGSCINNDKVTDCSEFTLERYIERLPAYREAGLTHVELSHLMALSTEDAAALRNACRDIGLSIWSVHSEHFNEAGGMSPGGMYEGGTLEQYFETQVRCAETAQAASAKIFVCHLPNYTKQPRFDLERNLKIIERLADITRKYGLVLAIENCLTGDLDHIIQIVDRLDRADVGINFDSGHCFCYQDHDIAGRIRQIGKRLVTLHLHDNFGENDDHQAPGIGLIDWESAIGAVMETPYEGPLMMELTAPIVKSRRTVPQLRHFPIEKELFIGAACLRSFFNKNKTKQGGMYEHQA